MELTSRAFPHKGKIPSLYTCDGKDLNPQLAIKNVPPKAASLALIMDDPDVPEFVRNDRMYVHWVVFDIPPGTTEIAENSTPPGIVGVNTDGKKIYCGPCPPDREHRYFFKLYALDKMLSLPAGATKAEVEQAMAHHILAQTELMGLYVRLGIDK